MERRDRGTTQLLLERSPWGAAACVLVVLAHALVVHTSLHLPSAWLGGAHMHDAAAHAPDALTSAAPAVADADGAELACGAVQWVAQRLEGLPDATVAPAALTPAPVVVLIVGIAALGLHLPRPPGPDRQAILQRFTL